MKRLTVVLVMLMSIGLAAQKHNGSKKMRKGAKMDLTTEEMATLQTKKMTLALDLTNAQQDKVYDINLENAASKRAKHEEMKALRESGERKKPTSEERFKMENERLDRQIAVQEQMKKILDEDQYESWKKMHKRKKFMHGKKKMEERGRRG
ncbi:hypothetical protein [Allomuricauda sp. F6463D]|uniref:hypothetical protein n=1 Tax=Allomuricauda sp. F6463D TaxID=2926409 RepID=UPI001FF46E10|nr:hypothetical protein [Muricauda sp. F6463D]MCK0161680.1 hypothetical protein [Muricauda sp. F6463D]